jgi:hypothetical protein
VRSIARGGSRFTRDWTGQHYLQDAQPINCS